MKRIQVLSFLLAFAALIPVYAQNSDLIASANAAYQAESYERAFAIISEGIPETSTNTALKRQAAEALAAIGIQEYNIRNFRNAYEAFRKALRYDPSNASAQQYFLRIRRELDVNNLRNEAGPRVAAVTTTTTPAATTTTTPAATTTTTTASTTPATTTTATTTPEVATPEVATPTVASESSTAATLPSASASAIDLTELAVALEEANARLSAMESSTTSANQENALLRAQADHQLDLLQSMIAAQAAAAQAAAAQAAAAQAAADRTAPVASAPAASAPAAVAPTQSAAEREMIARTLSLLEAMSEQETAPAQVVVQSDPELANLIASLNEQDRERSSQQTLNVILLIVVSVLGGGVVIFFLVFFLVSGKARKRSANIQQSRYETEQERYNNPPPAGYMPGGKVTDEPRLLEFIDSNSTAVGRPIDFDVRKDLLKAEHLKRMYDEVRTGTLSWTTVRDYIGELDVALKAEILKVVEQKINEGDLLSSEAILPIIFPFLTDFDDYIRDKSEKLARQSLIGSRAGGSSVANQTVQTEEDVDPLSIRNLMRIPQALKALSKNLDQSLVTAKLSRGIGNLLGLSTEECNLLYRTALAHDCGYLMLDQNQLQRTIAQPEISEEDFAFIQSHTLKGLTYFGDLELPEPFKEGLLHHHERNDGSGYPDGLKKDNIHLFAKVIGVAETFAALVSKRPHRDKRDTQSALAIIADGTRSKFDAKIVEALVKVASTIGGQ